MGYAAEYLEFSILNKTTKWQIFQGFLKFLTWYGFDESGWSDPTT